LTDQVEPLKLNSYVKELASLMDQYTVINERGERVWKNGGCPQHEAALLSAVVVIKQPEASSVIKEPEVQVEPPIVGNQREIVGTHVPTRNVQEILPSVSPLIQPESTVVKKKPRHRPKGKKALQTPPAQVETIKQWKAKSDRTPLSTMLSGNFRKEAGGRPARS
jgi:hypothetical protein